MADHYGDQGNSIQEDMAGTEFANLYGAIDRQSVHGLNLNVPEDARAVIKPWNERDDDAAFADSNVDDQLVIHIPFNQNVRLRSIMLKLGRGELTPRHLRLYLNQTNIVDFSEADSIKPHLNISLSEGDTGVAEYPLRAAAFSNVHSASLHFGEAVGEEVSRIYYIGFKGDTRTVKQEGAQKLVIPAANAADTTLVGKLKEKSASQQSTAR